MKYTMFRQRLVGAVALGLATAAILVPAASTQVVDADNWLPADTNTSAEKATNSSYVGKTTVVENPLKSKSWRGSAGDFFVFTSKASTAEGNVRVSTSHTAARPTPYACASKTVTAWLFPTGHKGGFIRGFGGNSDSRTPTAYVFNGSSSRPALRDLDAEAAFNPLTGVEIGFQCKEKRPLRSPLISLAKTRTTKPSKVVCSFPRVPLIWVDVLQKGQKRLNVVLPPRTLVIRAEMKTNGKTLSYAKRYCTKTAAPSRFVP